MTQCDWALKAYVQTATSQPSNVKITTVKSKGIMAVMYCTYAGDEIAIITTLSPSVTEIRQNHNGYDVPMPNTSLLGES